MGGVEEPPISEGSGAEQDAHLKKSMVLRGQIAALHLGMAAKIAALQLLAADRRDSCPASHPTPCLWCLKM